MLPACGSTSQGSTSQARADRKARGRGLVQVREPAPKLAFELGQARAEDALERRACGGRPPPGEVIRLEFRSAAFRDIAGCVVQRVAIRSMQSLPILQ